MAERCRNISKALAIVGELDGSLNHSVGGEMSMNLARLYQYLRERLTAANLMKEAEPLAEVESLLNTMAEAWAGVKRPGAQPAGIPSVPALEATPAYLTTPFIQGTESYQSSHSWTA